MVENLLWIFTTLYPARASAHGRMIVKYTAEEIQILQETFKIYVKLFFYRFKLNRVFTVKQRVYKGKSLGK